MNIAIIGMGGMGRRHIEAATKAGLTVTAICDMRMESAEDAVKNMADKPAIFTDWQQMLAQDSLFEVLVIATNGPSHHEIVLAAADAKIPYILCEKPMTTSGAKAREMAEACEKAGVRLAVNLSRRWMSSSIRLKKLLKDGIIGEIRHVNIHIGAGGLGCVGTHYFDMPAWLTDTRPAWVIGTIDENPAPNVRGEQFFDPGGRATVGYANGVTGTFEASGDVTRHSRGEIIGTKGVALFDDFAEEGMQVKFQARPEDKWDEPANWYFDLKEIEAGYEPGPFEMIDCTATCLKELIGDQQEDTITAGIDAVDMVLAIHLSARGGWEKIDLPLTGDDLEFDVPIT